MQDCWILAHRPANPLLPEASILCLPEDPPTSLRLAIGFARDFGERSKNLNNWQFFAEIDHICGHFIVTDAKTS